MQSPQPGNAHFWIPSMSLLYILWILIRIASVHGINFPYESIQLTDADVKNYSRIAFGTTPSPSTGINSSTGCKVYPGDAGWPSDAEWKKFNETLEGALIKGVPPAKVCYQPTYDATQCATVKTNYFYDKFRNDDPVAIVNEWLDGDSCPPAESSNVTASPSTCNLAAYPAYVVNVTTVKRKRNLIQYTTL